jgi:hypothetical protein
MFASTPVTNQLYVEEFFKIGEDNNEEKKRECNLCQKMYSKRKIDLMNYYQQ